MAEKVEKLGVNRDKDFMYYVKDGSVWRVQRKQPGVPKGRPEKVADGTFQMDTDFIYFVDKDGDVSRAKRAVGGQKRKKTAGRAKAKLPAKRSAGAKKAVKAKGRGKGGPGSASKAFKPSAKAKAGAKKPAGKAKGGKAKGGKMLGKVLGKVLGKMTGGKGKKKR
jgi:hypothetical protein